MADLNEWIEWLGVTGWSPHDEKNDQSDYGRACRIDAWIGTVPCRDRLVTVLGGDTGPITWVLADATPAAQFVEPSIDQAHWVGPVGPLA